MSISLRAATLRAALERVVDEPVRVDCTDRTVRLYAPAPPARDTDAWARLFGVLRTADWWGSTDAHGTPEVWAEITETEGDR
ncbi:hypothetical protein G3I51_23800 [Streptomyces sp. SID9944]|nr:hypothetical protein [Streptomyces sp. SID9944]